MKEETFIEMAKTTANNMIGEYMGLICMSVNPNLTTEQFVKLCKELAINKVNYVLDNLLDDLENLNPIQERFYENVLKELEKI
jgi:pyruvate/oxaloacetate carboxyltransferase